MTSINILVFLRIVAGGDDYVFRTKRGDYWREAIFEIFKGSRSLDQKMITSNKLNKGFLSVSNLVLCLLFNGNILGDRA